MTPQSANSDSQGFTLIEVLVGFVIVTLGLVSFYAGLGMSYRHVIESRMRHAALSNAQSHLATMGHTIAFEPGAMTGTYRNGQPWRMTVAALAVPTGAAEARLVVLATYDRKYRLLAELRTVKIAAARQ
jgi:general secretion pathway protein I